MPSDTVPTLDSLNEKVVEAAKVLESIPGFCDALDTDGTLAERTQAYVWARLAQLGIYQDENSHDLLMSDDCQEGEVRRTFCENGDPNVPPVRFKRMWSILRGGEAKHEPERASDVSDALLEALGKTRPIEHWRDTELVAAYGFDCELTIVDALRKRSQNRPFLVFNQDGSVDVETSCRMLRETRRREMPVMYQVSDSLKRLYRAGEFPGVLDLRCPFHDVILTDGYCDESKMTWEGVDYECMQFARIAQEEGEAGQSKPDIRQFIATARGEGLSGLSRDYPHVALIFQERKEADNLPNLKVRLSEPNQANSADPFGKRRF